MSLIWIDWMILAVMGISSLISVKRGFLKETLSLITWIVAAATTWFFSTSLSVYLSEFISSPTLRLLFTAIILFILLLVAGGFVNKLVNKLVVFSGFSGTDRALGMLFGAVRGALFVTVIVGFAGQSTINKEVWWQRSVLVPHFEVAAAWSKKAAMDIMAPVFG